MHRKEDLPCKKLEKKVKSCFRYSDMLWNAVRECNRGNSKAVDWDEYVVCDEAAAYRKEKECKEAEQNLPENCIKGFGRR